MSVFLSVWQWIYINLLQIEFYSRAVFCRLRSSVGCHEVLIYIMLLVNICLSVTSLPQMQCHAGFFYICLLVNICLSVTCLPRMRCYGGLNYIRILVTIFLSSGALDKRSPVRPRTSLMFDRKSIEKKKGKKGWSAISSKNRIKFIRNEENIWKKKWRLQRKMR